MQDQPETMLDTILAGAMLIALLGEIFVILSLFSH